MPVSRGGRELRVKLRSQEPRVIRQLDDLDEPVDRHPGEDETRLLETLHIAVVELVAMPVTLVDHVPAVDRPHEGRALELAALRPEPHRAAEIGVRAALLHAPALVLPFG